MAATTREMTPAVHNIGLWGLTGAIFFVLASALILYLEAFATSSWSRKDNTHSGLWHTCSDVSRPPSDEWLIATQVFAVLALVGLILSFGLIVVYMSANRASKNISIVSLAAIALITGVFLLVCLIIYGVHKDSNSIISWSYYVTLLATLLTLLGGILAVVQLRRSNVRL